MSDRIFFETVLDFHGRSETSKSIVEVISVGGKGFFDAYKKVLDACKIAYWIIADLDYVEQVGTPGIKALFEVDAREIKTDVIDNVKSLDGNALVNSIDLAIESGNWDHARSTWEYIKSRRRRLRNNLKQDEIAELEEFLQAERKKRIWILSRGNLEDYLPEGYGSKDLDKLIRFLNRRNFWEELNPVGKDELSHLAQALIPNLSSKKAT